MAFPMKSKTQINKVSMLELYYFRSNSFRVIRICEAWFFAQIIIMRGKIRQDTNTIYTIFALIEWLITFFESKAWDFYPGSARCSKTIKSDHQKSENYMDFSSLVSVRVSIFLESVSVNIHFHASASTRSLFHSENRLNSNMPICQAWEVGARRREVFDPQAWVGRYQIHGQKRKETRRDCAVQFWVL